MCPVAKPTQLPPYHPMQSGTESSPTALVPSRIVSEAKTSHNSLIITISFKETVMTTFAEPTCFDKMARFYRFFFFLKEVRIRLIIF
jgi:hypothetical protein